MAAAAQDVPKRRPSRLPTAVQFPLALVLSLAISTLGFSAVNRWTKGELPATGYAVDASVADKAILAGWTV